MACCCFPTERNRIHPIQTSNSLTTSVTHESNIRLCVSFHLRAMERIENDVEKLLRGSSWQEIEHDFKKKTFHKPTFCQHCSDLLWGLTNQGIQCGVCGYISHDKCRVLIKTPCTFKESVYVQIPTAHTLMKLINEKKRFCNICRRKIDDDVGLKCQCCPYYLHVGCQQYIVHNCKQTATYTTITNEIRKKQLHHWTEGHLPLDAKCNVCFKVCGSSDCLAGLRCMWCLQTIHSYCLKQVNRHCDFGALSNLVLPPFAIKKTNPLTFAKRQRKLYEARLLLRRSKIESVKSETGEIISSVAVYQGSANNPTACRKVIINPKSTAADIVKGALKVFHIKEQKENYFLTRTKTNNNEVKINPSEILWTLLEEHSNGDSIHPMIFLRKNNLDVKFMKIKFFAGLINSMIPSVDLEVNIMSQSSILIDKLLDEFNLGESESSDKYRIAVMSSTTDKVREMFLEPEESIHDALHSKNGLSKELSNIHFYLQPLESDVEELLLYVGNLPMDLTKHQYTVLLQDVAGKKDSFEIHHIFATQGSLILKFVNKDDLLSVIPQLNNARIDGKKWFIKIVPEIKEEMIPAGNTPLVVYVNSKSGGGQGLKLFTTFNRLLNPYQVVDITEAGPLPVLFMFRNIPHFKILICGGDGTFGWVLSALDDIRHNVLKCSYPESALLPLGTGNDLSRVLNWGPGYTGESILNVLLQVINAAPVFLDRWNVVFDEGERQQASSSALNIVPMNNYFGVGIDAALCLEFHLSREENPEKFNSRLYNKGVYFRAGLRNFTRSSMANIQEKLSLVVDGHTVELPVIEGLAINNISSWAAGSEPWGKDRDEKFAPPRYDDGLLEVLGFTGVYHMGKIKGGLATGIRIAQGSQINLQLKQALPVQVDGEPWQQNPCSIMIRPTLLQAKMLVKSSGSKNIPRSKTPPARTKFYHSNSVTSEDEESSDHRRRMFSDAKILDKPHH